MSRKKLNAVNRHPLLVADQLTGWGSLSCLEIFWVVAVRRLNKEPTNARLADQHQLQSANCRPPYFHTFKAVVPKLGRGHVSTWGCKTFLVGSDLNRPI